MIALDFGECMAWMVEVTSGHVKILLKKGAAFEQEYAPRLRRNLIDDQVFPDEAIWETWKLGMWAFVPSWAKASVEKKLLKSISHGRVTALEDVAFPWVYWDNRCAGSSQPTSPILE